MMQLYSFFNSSTSYRVRIALELKGIEYIYKPVNIREARSEEYARLNPSTAVPVLVDGDRVLTQSMVILQYLDEQYPEPRLIPTEIQSKFRALEISNSIACDIHPVNNLRILAYLKNKLDVSDVQKSQWYTHWIEQGFNSIEILLNRDESGRYSVGDVPGIADCCLIPQVANALRMGCDLTGYKRTMEIMAACLELPAFQRAAPEKQPDYIV